LTTEPSGKDPGNTPIEELVEPMTEDEINEIRQRLENEETVLTDIPSIADDEK
jgi:hypothetical protein